MERNTEICNSCGRKMVHIASGEYRCNFCGYNIIDDKEKIREFFRKNKTSLSSIISNTTGVKAEFVQKFLDTEIINKTLEENKIEEKRIEEKRIEEKRIEEKRIEEKELEVSEIKKDKKKENLLKENKLKIKNPYLKCERCGCNIQSGRFCTSCVKDLADGIKNVFINSRKF